MRRDFVVDDNGWGGARCRFLVFAQHARCTNVYSGKLWASPERRHWRPVTRPSQPENAVNIISVHLLNSRHFMDRHFFLPACSSAARRARPQHFRTDKISSPLFSLDARRAGSRGNVIMLTSFYLIFILKLVKSRKKWWWEGKCFRFAISFDSWTFFPSLTVVTLN